MCEQNNQGNNSISIGYQCSNTYSNSIILNASGNYLTNASSNAFVVSPIRSDTTQSQSGLLYYNKITSEIKYIDSLKTFIIPHPIVPEEKYLVHACLEGPEAGVYYRGSDNFILNNPCKIELPLYVSTLATKLTIQLTPIIEDITQQIIPTIAATEIKDNIFYVIGNISCKFHWTVFGCRKSIIVEPIKTSVNINGCGPYKWIDTNE